MLEVSKHRCLETVPKNTFAWNPLKVAHDETNLALSSSRCTRQKDFLATDP